MSARGVLSATHYRAIKALDVAAHVIAGAA